MARCITLLNRLLFVYFRDPRGAEIGSSFSAAGVEPTWERTYLYLFTLGQNEKFSSYITAKIN
jgi:hypothetical protein